MIEIPTALPCDVCRQPSDRLRLLGATWRVCPDCIKHGDLRQRPRDGSALVDKPAAPPKVWRSSRSPSGMLLALQRSCPEGAFPVGLGRSKMRGRRFGEPYAYALDPCVYCGSVAESVDHIVPRSAGGADSQDNLAPSCKACNQDKKNLPLLLFLLRRVSCTTQD